MTLEDFGTGYTTPRYLKQLPQSKLIIDRAFVRDMPGSKADEAIVRAEVSVARAVDSSVTAEGVETEAQYLALTQLGCNNL